jgi:hypothetical protein
MRVAIVESRPGELDGLTAAEVAARLDEAFYTAREAIAKGVGAPAGGEVTALDELAAMMTRAYQRRAERLRADILATRQACSGRP